jgi:hypothetical protein
MYQAYIRIQSLESARKVTINELFSRFNSIKMTKGYIIQEMITNIYLCQSNIKLDYLKDCIKDSNILSIFYVNNVLSGFMVGEYSEQSFTITTFCSTSGYGKIYLSSIIEYIKKNLNIEYVDTKSVYSAIGFYMKCGFEILNVDDVPLLLSLEDINLLKSTNKKKMTDIYQDRSHKNTLLKIYSHITASNLDKDNMYQELINNRTFNHGIYMKYRF